MWEISWVEHYRPSSLLFYHAHPEYCLLSANAQTLAGLYLVHEIGPTRATLGPYLFPLGDVIFGLVFLREI